MLGLLLRRRTGRAGKTRTPSRALTPAAARRKVDAARAALAAEARRRTLLDRLLGRRTRAHRRAEAALAAARAALERAEREAAEREARRLRRLERSPAVRANQRRIKALLIAEQDPEGTGRVRCYYCRRSVGIADCHLEHRRPVSRGGGNTRANTVLACPRCNLGKGAMSERAFRRKKGLPLV